MRTESGYTLMELMVVLAIGGLLLAATLPALGSYTRSNDVKSAARNVATQLSMAHERAISTGTTQTFRFIKDYDGKSDYHVWNNNIASPSWRLPRNVTYYWGVGTQNTFRMTSDGRSQDAGYVILQDERGNRDTVSVRLSGLVLVY